MKRKLNKRGLRPQLEPLEPRMVLSANGLVDVGAQPEGASHGQDRLHACRSRLDGRQPGQRGLVDPAGLRTLRWSRTWATRTR